MRPPAFHHLVGADQWLHCDHDRTQVHDPTASVRLATREQTDRPAPIDPQLFELALEQRGGAAIAGCPPDRCADGVVVLADPGGQLYALREHGWEPLVVAPAGTPGPTRFTTAAAPPALFDRPGALAADRFGRLWLLERGADRVRLLHGGTLHPLATVDAPAGADLVDLGVASWGLLAADRAGRRLWRQPFGGEWRALELSEDGDPTVLAGFAPVAAAGHPAGPAVAILRPDAADLRSQLVLVESGRARIFEIPGLEDPLHLVMPAPTEVLIGEAGSPGTARAAFLRFGLGDQGLAEIDGWAVRGFDGRALFCGLDGRLFATTAAGARRLFRREAELETEGVVETFALDSELYGCTWHRLFVDVCLPPGTAVELVARTADDLPPDSLRREPRPAQGRSAPPSLPDDDPRKVAGRRLPLGSRTIDDREGWEPLGQLDRRPAQIDIPLPPLARALPSEDAYATSRGPLTAAMALETLEGLIKNPGGRYLWLRLTLRGTTRRSPAVQAVRATYPRPSLLDHLPAYWRAEPGAARAMEHALALFEGTYTEIDRRIGEFRRLLDARTTPPEAIEWLAGLVALAFDTRVPESVRRQLLGEMTRLYRQRGTVPGLRRLVAILGQCEVQIVEGFRVRRRLPAFLGAEGTAPRADDLVLGPGLQLGAQEAGSAEVEREPWEAELASEHAALLERRSAVRAAGGEPCPAAEPPTPFDPDPLISFYRRHADRFSVLLFRPRAVDLEAVIENAIEASKPAHTLHRLCWLDAGFRLGTNSYVGIGTRFGGTEGFRPAILEAPLGAGRTLGRGEAGLGFTVGALRLDGASFDRKAGLDHDRCG